MKREVHMCRRGDGRDDLFQRWRIEDAQRVENAHREQDGQDVGYMRWLRPSSQDVTVGGRARCPTRFRFDLVENCLCFRFDAVAIEFTRHFWLVVRSIRTKTLGSYEYNLFHHHPLHHESQRSPGSPRGNQWEEYESALRPHNETQDRSEY